MFFATDMCGKRAWLWKARPMFRLWVGTLLTRRSSNQISPSVRSISPATIRRVVVLPQPEGPSRVMNSPCWMSALTWSTATVEPNVLTTSTNRTRAMPAPR